MGNGPRVIYGGSSRTISLDIETSPLTLADIEQAAAKAVANFGKPSHIFLGNATAFTYHPNPQYEGTEWASMSRMTKREHAFAKLQVFLIKFGLQKHLEDDDARRADARLCEKRLKRAKWARYQQSKKDGKA